MANTIVLIQFERTYVQDFRNQMIKDLSIMKNYGGSCLGIGEELFTDEGTWFRNKAIAVFEFSDAAQAQLWIDSDPGTHQPDFMHGADIIAVASDKRGSAHCWMQIMDINVPKNMIGNFKQYAKDQVSSLEKCGGSQILCSDRSRKVRGLWDADTGILIINQFSGLSDYRNWYCGEEYRKIRTVRDNMASSKVVSFQMRPLCVK